MAIAMKINIENFLSICGKPYLLIIITIRFFPEVTKTVSSIGPAVKETFCFWGAASFQ
jgi:hypothetical protein